MKAARCGSVPNQRARIPALVPRPLAGSLGGGGSVEGGWEKKTDPNRKTRGAGRCKARTGKVFQKKEKRPNRHSATRRISSIKAASRAIAGGALQRSIV